MPVAYLVIHGIDPIGTQQIDGLANQVGASAVEHPEAQVQLELICGGFGIQTPEGAKAALWPRRGGWEAKSNEGGSEEEEEEEEREG